MKEIKYTILYCVCENFCYSINYGSGLSISDPYHFALDADSTFHFNAHTDLAPQKSGANLQPLAYRPPTAH
jgi:hypothetical protein